jgi:succinyl-CoA synthetase beta subunit
MKLFEYQAKELFADAGIPVPKGKVIEDISMIDAALDAVGLPCVIKAQVLTGGRGKAGLIQFASSREEATEKAALLFGPENNIKKLLIEQALDIGEEIYLAITVDPVNACALIMASSQGGVDIEEIAKNSPEKIVRQEVDVTCGIMSYQARNVMFDLGLKGDAFKQTLKILFSLFKLFKKHDAELVEINPLVITRDGAVIAADGKISLDDNAAFRQQEYPPTREYFDSDIEFEAAQKGIPYIQFDGDIGLMCAGAGLTNTVYDLINDYGGSVSNFLEFGGPNYKRAVEAMELTLKSNPKVVLIVTFGTIARADVMANGIAEAIDKLNPKIPIVTAVRGTGEEEARKILQQIGLEPSSDTEQAVRRAVELAKGDSE